jgi:flavin-binding protein dodecin
VRARGCGRRLVGTEFDEEDVMSASVARITHISARSDTSFDDAVRIGVERAAQTLRNVSGAWVKEQTVKVEDGRIVAWQVVLEVTFVLE